MADPVRWWEMRPAQGRQVKTYTCAICHGLFLAMVPNTLLYPEGDRRRRRHAHTECVARQRRAGELLTKAEWERANRVPESGRQPWWRRLLGPRPAKTEPGRG